MTRTRLCHGVSLRTTPDAVDIGTWTGMLKLQGVVMVSPASVAAEKLLTLRLFAARTLRKAVSKAAATPGAAPRSAAMFQPAGGVTTDRLSVTALPRPIVVVP